MSNYDAELPIRAIPADATVGLADSANVRINPAKEDGHLNNIDTKLPASLGQKTSAGSLAVVLPSDMAPILVTFAAGTGDEVATPNANTDVAAGATVDHTLTPTGNVLLDGVDVNASGQVFVTVAWGPTGSEVVKWRGFSSKGDLNVSFRPPNGIALTNLMTVKVSIKNEDKQPFDVFSTIFTNP